jgi:hypothetical protein
LKIIKYNRGKLVEAEFEVRDRRQGMYQVDDEYLNGWARKCGVYATAVYNVMCRHVGKDQSCFPGVDLIADKLAISARQVSRAIKILEAHKIIEVQRVAGGKSKYWLTDKTEWRDSKVKWHHYENCRPAKEPVDAMTYVDKNWPNRIRPRGDA